MIGSPVITGGAHGFRLWIGNAVVDEPQTLPEAMAALNQARKVYARLHALSGREQDQTIRNLSSDDIEAALWTAKQGSTL